MQGCTAAASRMTTGTCAWADLGGSKNGKSPRDLGVSKNGKSPRDLGVLTNGTRPRDLGVSTNGTSPRAGPDATTDTIKA